MVWSKTFGKIFSFEKLEFLFQATLLITANVPSTKKIIIHGPDVNSIPTQYPIHEVCNNFFFSYCLACQFETKTFVYFLGHTIFFIAPRQLGLFRHC